MYTTLSMYFTYRMLFQHCWKLKEDWRQSTTMLTVCQFWQVWPHRACLCPEHIHIIPLCGRMIWADWKTPGHNLWSRNVQENVMGYMYCHSMHDAITSDMADLLEVNKCRERDNLAERVHHPSNLPLYRCQHRLHRHQEICSMHLFSNKKTTMLH